MKQYASLDASFWINVCNANIAAYLKNYFQLYAASVVAKEIRYPLDILGIPSSTAVLFNQWVEQGVITIQDPQTPVDWFQSGENAAIGLAMENRCFLLIDDANPYHKAKAAGIKVVGSSEFIIFLFDQAQISFDQAIEAFNQSHASKKQKRDALFALELLKRYKEE